jgi:GTPase SAR1 family protein
MPPTYMRKASIIIFPFAFNDSKSFDVLPFWLEESENNPELHDSVKVVVGTKLDAENKVVSMEAAQKLAKDNKAYFFATSAKTGIFARSREILTVF